MATFSVLAPFQISPTEIPSKKKQVRRSRTQKEAVQGQQYRVLHETGRLFVAAV